MTDTKRCYYGTAMLRKSIIPKNMRFGIIPGIDKGSE